MLKFTEVCRCIIAISLVVSLVSCSFLLPSRKIEKNAQWDSFEEIQTVYNKVRPNETNVTTLKNFGFDPYVANNVKIENYLNIRTRFDPLSTGKNIPMPVSECLNIFKRCQAYVVNLDYEYEKRLGNALLDVTGFKKEISKEGWAFQAVFIIHDDTVVYKLWSGEPKRKAYIEEIRPLGPLQGLGNLIAIPTIAL